MKIILVGINAKYIHSALAVHQLYAVLKNAGIKDVFMAEYTINQRAEDILEDLMQKNGDAYLFSCYIWNISFVKQITASMHKINPKAVLAAGGPQVEFCAKSFLEDNLQFRAILTQEGETNIVEFANNFINLDKLKECPNLFFRNKLGRIIKTKEAPPFKMDQLPFAYTSLDLVQGRIVYYESMRGCPYNCSYCLSGASKGVRYKSLEKVYEELDVFLKAKIKQVKFVDRTFNCDAQRALLIWKYLIKHDNGITGFHFEIVGSILDDEALLLLHSVRPGLFQLEMGVQSTNKETLKEINRDSGLEKTLQNAKKISTKANVHVHLDLIAGLPKENYESFSNSFNIVYTQKPHQLQLGFLKVLSGSAMEMSADEYGIVWQSEPPHEILFNNWLNYDEICKLKWIAEMVELYYNSGRFGNLIAHICKKHASPFKFYSMLANYYKKENCHLSPLSKLGQYQLLWGFAKSTGHRLSQKAQWLCRLDIAQHEKPKAMPKWVKVDGSLAYRERALAFYKSKKNILQFLPNYCEREPKQLLKMLHIEVMPFNPKNGKTGECALLFDYNRKDITGKALCMQICLP